MKEFQLILLFLKQRKKIELFLLRLISLIEKLIGN